MTLDSLASSLRSLSSAIGVLLLVTAPVLLVLWSIRAWGWMNTLATAGISLCVTVIVWLALQVGQRNIDAEQ